MESAAAKDRRRLWESGTTTGGNALKFYASVRLDIRKTGVIKDGEMVVGTKTRVKVAKNKVAPPFREAEFEIMYGQGVNVSAELVDLGSAANVIEKSGAFYSYKGERIGQGRDKAAADMAVNPKVATEIRTKAGRSAPGRTGWRAPVGHRKCRGGVKGRSLRGAGGGSNIDQPPDPCVEETIVASGRSDRRGVARRPSSRHLALHWILRECSRP